MSGLLKEALIDITHKGYCSMCTPHLDTPGTLED